MAYYADLSSLLRVNQPENIIEDVIAASPIRTQLKHLGIIHGPLLLINLSPY